MTRILIIEDEIRIAAFLEKGLQADGFTTTHAQNGRSALNLTFESKYDLIILDLGLPDQDGMTILTALRGQGMTQPIIVLTARDDIHDKVSGFEAGADDYVTKPFRFEELLARIRARLRVTQPGPPPTDNLLTLGAITLDLYSDST